uniref:Uncharacterized protein n=1 Tax=viral metagenome TaxID=1070528 RepID=A0A6M3IU96_9ZZZZ
MDKAKYQIGEIRKGKEIGYKNPNCKWKWAACPDCGLEHWILYRISSIVSSKCRSCAQKGKHPTEVARANMSLASRGRGKGELNPSWRGGIHYNHDRYRLIKIYDDDFFYPMAMGNGYVLEHRLVMAKSLGRNLHSWEIVHHKHTKYPARSIEDKRDNRIENLQLVSDDEHKQITLLENRVRYLENRVTSLETEIILLKSGSLKPIMDGG